MKIRSVLISKFMFHLCVNSCGSSFGSGLRFQVSLPNFPLHFLVSLFLVARNPVRFPLRFCLCVLLFVAMTGAGPSKDPDQRSLIAKLDFGDPLYLHPSDTSGASILTLKLIGTDNYKVWACAMTLALETKNKLGFIDGTVIRSVENDVLGKQWDRCNSVVLSWILNSISEDLFVSQVFSRVASEVWTELKETCDKIDGSVTFNLHQKINSLSQNGASVSDYYHKLNALWKQFDALVKLPSCTCNAANDFSKHSQLIKLMQFLMGLDDNYVHIRSNILTTDPLPSVKTAFSLVSREESHRGVTKSSDTKGSQHTAFFGKTNDKKKSGKSFLSCKHCGLNGHTIERCYKLIGFPKDFQFTKSKLNQGFKPSSSNSCVTDTSGCSQNVHSSLTEDQISKLLSLLDQKQTDNISVNMAGMLSVNVSNFSNSQSGWIFLFE
ncbi:hypothetical protein L6452_39439 [Arctium lappa]|uniref:Uncharacterized protein n=1 Tax=Arctium lappa TaxID=4217 RepID=A0ACB8XU01_ARCLA|nr:hypothetical protein L6452_39439 [Arctium lappa]